MNQLQQLKHKMAAGLACLTLLKKITLAGNQSVEIKIKGIHVAGELSLHMTWSGPGLDKQILLPLKSQLAVAAGCRLLSP